MGYVFLWCLCGLIGHAVWLVKQTTGITDVIIGCIIVLPFALLFGPFWLLINLLTTGQMRCPYCREKIRRDATVCPRCTRQVTIPGEESRQRDPKIIH